MSDLLIKNCDVFCCKDNKPDFLLSHDILVTGNRIQSILPTSESTTTPVKNRIDASGMLAVPGMVNTHAHVPMVLFRGVAEDVTLEEWFNQYIFPMESNLTPEDVFWGALLGMAEMIEAGITNVADHYFFMDEVAEAIKASGIRGNLAWAVFEHEGLEKFDETVEFVKRWQGRAEGRIKTWLGPHSPYLCGPEFLTRCAQLAEGLDVGIHIHVAETEDQVALSQKQYGMTPIRLLAQTGVLNRPSILAHCCFPTNEDIDIIADHPAGVGQAPKTYMRAGMGLGPLKAFQERDIPVGLASDGAASNSTLDLYEQMRLMALTQKFIENDARVMPLDKILKIAYAGGARVCQENDLGVLAPNKLADIVLLRQDRSAVIPRLNPAANLVYAINAVDVDTVICNGVVLMHNRQLLTIDKEKIKGEIESRLARLVKKVPGKMVAVYPT